MRDILRTDGVPVFEDTDKNLKVVIADHKLKQKAEGYRIALKSYVENRNKQVAYKELESKFEEQSKLIQSLVESIEDLNFVIRTKLLTEQK